MTEDVFFRLVIDYAPVLIALLAIYLIGDAVETRHMRQLQAREAATRSLLTLTLESAPAGWTVLESDLVSGSMVISIDYFRRLTSSLRSLVGGNLRPYERLLERGRREALLRMKENALARRFDAVVNLRFETVRLGAGAESGGSVELLVVGTALRRAAPSAPARDPLD